MSVVFGITGWKNSGKTTLVAALVREFTARGFRTSTVKHAHDSFSIDRDDTDSAAHRNAGAGEVALVSGRRWALMHENGPSELEISLKSILAKLSPCDIVLTEGFKTSSVPKIECIRQATAREEAVWKSNNTVVAVASDHISVSTSLPILDLNDAGLIADFIAERTGLAK